MDIQKIYGGGQLMIEFTYKGIYYTRVIYAGIRTKYYILLNNKKIRFTRLEKIAKIHKIYSTRTI